MIGFKKKLSKTRGTFFSITKHYHLVCILFDQLKKAIFSYTTHKKCDFSKHCILNKTDITQPFLNAFYIVAVLAAEVIPHLALFISLVGAIASTFLALIFPPICHMVVWKDEGFGTLNWKLHMDIITIVLGLLGFVTGTYFSLYDIMVAFGKDFGFH